MLYCKSNPYTGLDRPLGPQEIEASRIARHSVHEGGNLSAYALVTFIPQEIPLVLIFIRG